MNDLNLRVTATKLATCPKQFSKVRETRLEIPKGWTQSRADFVLEFASAETCKEQFELIQKICERPETQKFLADLLLSCPLKDPALGFLTSFFSDGGIAKLKNKVHTKESLVEALGAAFTEIALSIADIDNTDVEAINDVFLSASHCLQYCKYGTNAFLIAIKLFIPLIPKALERYYRILERSTEVPLAPTQRNDTFVYINNVCRFHNVVGTLIRMIPNDCEELRQMNGIVEKVIEVPDTPLNLRNVAAQSIATNLKIFDEHIAYLEDFTELRDLNDLPRVTAVLMVVDDDDFQQHWLKIMQIIRICINAIDNTNMPNNIIVFTLRNFMVYTKFLACKQPTQSDPQQIVVINQILCQMMRCGLKHISSPVDAVRRSSEMLLTKVFEIAKNLGQPSNLLQFYTDLPKCQTLNGICAALQQVLQVYGAAELRKYDGIDSTFKECIGKKDCVNSLYKAFMRKSFEEQPYEEWYDYFVRRMLHPTMQANFNSREVVEHVIKIAVATAPRVLDDIMRDSPTLNIKIVAMRTARAEGGAKHAKHLKYLIPKFNKELEESLDALDDHMRVLALQFAVETPKLSETLTEAELSNILSYVVRNANKVNTHIRQRSYAILQKAIKRLELNLKKSLKSQLPSNGNDDYLMQFMHSMLNALTLNLFPTSNQARRWLSLKLLLDLTEMLTMLKIEWRSRMPPQLMPHLESCLHDNYENIKLLAARFMSRYQDHDTHKPAEMMARLTSARPADSCTAVYQLHVYCQAANVAFAIDPQPDHLPAKYARHYVVLNWCLIELKAGSDRADRDLNEAARKNPLYGLLFASRYLLQQVRLDQIAKEQLWRQYIEQLIELCMRIAEQMLPIVGSDSPEGYIPVPDLKSNETVLESDEPPADQTSTLATGASTLPQLVLLCGWRCIKEISLIFGEVVSKAPLQHEEPDDYLLDVQQVTDIGDHYLKLLATIKHRGAFEQAYVGFTMLCGRFWRSDAMALNQLPAAWLDDAMSLIKGNTENGHELCSTRRSAGVPYMLQALICTELQLGSQTTFHTSMGQLLAICERADSTPQAAIARGHALNIMRALFRCSELAELVSCFILRGVRCAMESIDSREWSERNSATLLLSALMVRIFGVERARQDNGRIHIDNCMTGRIFFTTYPELFNYFDMVLSRAAKDTVVADFKYNMQLDAVLQVLCRLYPSASEGDESTLNIEQFLPHLLDICASRNGYTRKLATRVLTVFSKSGDLPDFMAKNLNCLLIKENNVTVLDLNQVDGQLKMYVEVYDMMRWKNQKIVKQLLTVLSALILGPVMLNMVLIRDIVSLLNKILSDTPNNLIESNVVDDLMMTMLIKIRQMDGPKLHEACRDKGVSLKFMALYKLYIDALTGDPVMILDHMLTECIVHLPLSILSLHLSVWLTLLLERETNSSRSSDLFAMYDERVLNLDPDAIAFCRSLTESTRMELVELIRSSAKLSEFMIALLDLVFTSPKLNSKIGCQLLVLFALVETEDTQCIRSDWLGMLEYSHPDLDAGLSVCLLTNLDKSDTTVMENQELVNSLLTFVCKISTPNQETHQRYKAAQLTNRLIIYSNQAIWNIHNSDIIGGLIRLALQLLNDESPEVRKVSAVGVAHFLGHFKTDINSLQTCDMEERFLACALGKIAIHATEPEFLLELFATIVEPFASNETQLNLNDPDADLLQLFDKSTDGVYCENLRIVSMVAKSFLATFQNSQLHQVIASMEKCYDFSGEYIVPGLFI